MTPDIKVDVELPTAVVEWIYGRDINIVQPYHGDGAREWRKVLATAPWRRAGRGGVYDLHLSYDGAQALAAALRQYGDAESAKDPAERCVSPANLWDAADKILRAVHAGVGR